MPNQFHHNHVINFSLLTRIETCDLNTNHFIAGQGSIESSSVTQTELEVEPHDDDDVYLEGGHLENGEEEIPTEDEYVAVEGHDGVAGEPCPSASVGSTHDQMDTLAVESQEPAPPNDSQVEHLEPYLEDDLKSDDEKKGARKVGSGRFQSVCFGGCFGLSILTGGWDVHGYSDVL